MVKRVKKKKSSKILPKSFSLINLELGSMLVIGLIVSVIILIIGNQVAPETQSPGLFSKEPTEVKAVAVDKCMIKDIQKEIDKTEIDLGKYKINFFILDFLDVEEGETEAEAIEFCVDDCKIRDILQEGKSRTYEVTKDKGVFELEIVYGKHFFPKDTRGGVDLAQLEFNRKIIKTLPKADIKEYRIGKDKINFFITDISGIEVSEGRGDNIIEYCVDNCKIRDVIDEYSTNTWWMDKAYGTYQIDLSYNLVKAGELKGAAELCLNYYKIPPPPAIIKPRKYMDPTRCKSKVEDEETWWVDSRTGERYYPNNTRIKCKYNEFVGSVTHIDCPNFNDERVIVGTGWMTDTLPNQISYTCVNKDNIRKAPNKIFYYCCEIQNFKDVEIKISLGKKAVQEHKATTSKQGKTIQN